MEVRRYRRLNKRVPNNQKGQGDLGVSLRQDSPGKVLYHGVVLVLPSTVICPVQLSAWRYTSFSPIVKTISKNNHCNNNYGFSIFLCCGARRSSEAG